MKSKKLSFKHGFSNELAAEVKEVSQGVAL